MSIKLKCKGSQERNIEVILDDKAEYVNISQEHNEFDIVHLNDHICIFRFYHDDKYELSGKYIQIPLELEENEFNSICDVITIWKTYTNSIIPNNHIL